jgi:hypothetical protein
MNGNSNVVCHPDEIDDPLTNYIPRSGARQLLAQAIELEAELAEAAEGTARAASQPGASKTSAAGRTRAGGGNVASSARPSG